MQTPVVYNLLALEMKKQADARGFADDEKKKRFLNKEEIARVKRATKQTSDIDHEAVQREWRDLQRAQEAFSRKQAEMAQKKKNKEAKAMAKEAQQESLAKRDAKIRKQYEAKAKSDEEEKKQLKADMEKLRQENEQTKRDTIVSNLFTALDVGKAFGVPREAVINKFSKDNKMTLDEVRALVERYKF
jgi:membrane protein involved in colicin uptake